MERENCRGVQVKIKQRLLKLTERGKREMNTERQDTGEEEERSLIERMDQQWMR